MVRINVSYEGGLHCAAVHAPSRTALATDAPVDNQGRGESFSPTDLVATALGTCILTTMGIAAQRFGIRLDGSHVSVDKVMTTDGPRRIARLIVDLHLAIAQRDDPKGALEAIAHSCPVLRSLHPGVAVDVTVHWHDGN